MVIPDYSNPDTPHIQIKTPVSSKGLQYKPSYHSPDDLRDPSLQDFHRVATLSGADRRKFSTHVLPNGDTRYVLILFPIKVPGSPVFLPRPLLNGYLPMLKAAMADYADQFPIDRAVISINAKMGSLSPSNPEEEFNLYKNGEFTDFHNTTSSKMTATFWHIDGGGRHEFKGGYIGKADRWYICANRLRTTFAKARGFDISELMNQKGDLAEMMAKSLNPNEIGYSDPYTVYRFSPLALHRGEDLTQGVLAREGCERKGKIFRHFATLNIFIPADDQARSVESHIYRNGPLYQWMKDQGRIPTIRSRLLGQKPETF